MEFKSKLPWTLWTYEGNFAKYNPAWKGLTLSLLSWR